MSKIDEIVEKVAELSVLECSELVKALEEKFGVTAAAPMMMGGMMPMGGWGLVWMVALLAIVAALVVLVLRSVNRP